MRGTYFIGICELNTQWSKFKEVVTSLGELGLIGIIGNLGRLDDLGTEVVVKSKILLTLCEWQNPHLYYIRI